MAGINKGKISSISGNTARVLPATASASVSRPYTIPWYLRGEMGGLSVGSEVVFATFDDASGIVLARMDGDWPGTIPDNITITGTVQATAAVTIAAALTASSATVAGVSVEGHKHTDSVGGETSAPH
ncbi:MAG: pre-mRNA-splicing factor [Clostridiaceae bacterium]|nr:pre-mRNA-splicing factor [Clostridiaceae bacterium]DAM37345.1 MAG TPA: Protein gp45-helix, central spike, Mu phage.44A [Caudoviricetes sp.]